MHIKNKRGDSTSRTVKLQSWQAKYQSMNTPGTLKSASCILNRNNGPCEFETGCLVYGAQACTMTSCSDLSDAPNARTRNAEWPSATLEMKAHKQPCLAGDPSKQKQGGAETPALVVTYSVLSAGDTGPHHRSKLRPKNRSSSLKSDGIINAGKIKEWGNSCNGSRSGIFPSSYEHWTAVHCMETGITSQLVCTF